MKFNEGKKGQYGYIKVQKKRTIIKTIIMLTLSFSIFAIGWWSAGTQKNLLTIVAVLGLLPASKSAVNMIMFIRAKGCSETAYIKIAEHSRGFLEAYDLFFTSYNKNYQVSHLVMEDKVICGYTEDLSCDSKACEKHIESLLKQGGCKNITIKIYKDIEKYCEGLDNLKKQRNKEVVQEEQYNDIWSNLSAISL